MTDHAITYKGTDKYGGLCGLPSVVEAFPDIMTTEDPGEAAAKLFAAIIKDGANPDTAKLLTPEDADYLGRGNYWRVMWEEGPYEWGVVLTLNLMANDYWYGEPYHSFDVGFIT